MHFVRFSFSICPRSNSTPKSICIFLYFANMKIICLLMGGHVVPHQAKKVRKFSSFSCFSYVFILHYVNLAILGEYGDTHLVSKHGGAFLLGLFMWVLLKKRFFCFFLLKDFIFYFLVSIDLLLFIIYAIGLKFWCLWFLVLWGLNFD